MSNMRNSRPAREKNAIDRGILVSFIQKAVVVGWWNTNSMPVSLGSEVRFISPYSCCAELDAMRALMCTFRLPVSMSSDPLGKDGDGEGDGLGPEPAAGDGLGSIERVACAA